MRPGWLNTQQDVVVFGLQDALSFVEAVVVYGVKQIGVIVFTTLRIRLCVNMIVLLMDL